MKIFFVFFLVLLSSQQAHSESLFNRLKGLGKSFKCWESFADTNADICVLKKPRDANPRLDYSKAIAFVIPHSEREVTNPDKIMLHLQGYRGVCTSKEGEVDTNATPSQMLENFDLVPQFLNAIQEAEAQNSVLVFPISMGKNTDYYNEFVGHFKAFSQWVETVVAADPHVGWYVSGHSGAGAIISLSFSAAISTAPKIRSIMLEDATYGIPNHIDEWQKIAKANPDIKIESVYRPGSSTESGSLQLKKVLNGLSFKKQRMLRYPVKISATPVKHCMVPNKFYESMLKHALK